ncbi:MAG: class I SAM-dependent RNA methyltransferase [Deltaproteobacteria bacterium]|nr:class I SAM-dependent RNA methyltransferase [Deltaproteobacteria bacterium]MBW2414493.1 class I SAM-dependent RNA methyltransferase [Deltaproteobacteria bacterium]
MSLEPGTIIELVIDGLAAGGDGVGRFDGRAVFVPLTAPGDRVAAEVVRVQPRWARAEPVQLLDAGTGRREAPCGLFGECGGCSWLHLTPAAQRDARLTIARDALTRIGHFESLPELEWLPSPVELGYRARARVSLAPDEGIVGFHMRRSDRIVDVERCAVLDAMTQRELDRLRADPGGDSFDRLRSDQVEIRGFGREALGLHVSRGSFFQANGAIWRQWRDAVAEACGRGASLVELYAGVGFFTTALEPRFEQIVAVERAASVADLRANTKAQVVHKSAEAFAVEELSALSPEVVLVNPPRTGCDSLVVDAIRRSGARRVVYVSCDPPTLARDLSRLGDGYHLRRLVVVDAMPQTHHVELFALLEC